MKNYLLDCGTLIHRELFDFISPIFTHLHDQHCLPGAHREGKKKIELLIKLIKFCGCRIYAKIEVYC